MKEKYIKYYEEMFNVWDSEFFLRLWGDSEDEWGDSYLEHYKYELIEMKTDFAEFMYLFKKYNIELDKKSISMKILNMFEGLGGCDIPTGSLILADMIIHADNIKLGFNDAKHPLK